MSSNCVCLQAEVPLQRLHDRNVFHYVVFGVTTYPKMLDKFLGGGHGSIVADNVLRSPLTVSCGLDLPAVDHEFCVRDVGLGKSPERKTSSRPNSSPRNLSRVSWAVLTFVVQGSWMTDTEKAVVL